MKISEICTELASLSVPGVTIKDLTGIPDALHAGNCPMLYPEPAGFVNELTIQRDGWGLEANAPKTAQYTLAFTYAHGPVGQGRGLAENYPALVDKAEAIIDAIQAHDWTTPNVVHVDVQPVDGFGVVPDPQGNSFYGFRLRLRVTEFIN